MTTWSTGVYGFHNYDSISSESLSLLDLGVEHRENEPYDFSNNNRKYEGYLLQFTLEGCGQIEHNNTFYKLPKGTGFLLPFPNSTRYFLPSEEPHSQWIFFYIHFQGPAVLPFFEKLKELNSLIFQLELDSPPIRQFFQLYTLLNTKRPLEPYKNSEWLYTFLISLLRSVELPNYTKKNLFVIESIEWMQSNFFTQKNIEDMCREIGVSFSHLSRQFLKDEGLTPIEYLTHLRLQHSINLLLNSNLSINEIASQCGYSSGNYFSKVFKKAMATSPNEYRTFYRLY